METFKKQDAIFGTVLVLSGCSFLSYGLWPSLTGDSPQAPAPAAQPQAAPQPPAPMAVIQPVPKLIDPARPGSATGTFVGAKAAQLLVELENLKSVIGRRNAEFQSIHNTTVQNSQQYHATVAAINARLQVGTTPGNPLLVRQWNVAQSELDRVRTDIAAMTTMGNEVAADSSMASYLLEATRAAFGLSGAIDADHRRLEGTEDEVNRTIVLIERLLGEINEATNRQTTYVNNERRNLMTLSLAIKNGEAFGVSLGSPSFAAPTATPLARATIGPANGGISRGLANLGGLPSRRPLVVIRFDRPDVPYEQALYTAISRALERRPSVRFDLVAVTPNFGSPSQVALNTNNAKRNAQRVMRSLVDMGLPASRVTMASQSSTGVRTNEVRIYVR